MAAPKPTGPEPLDRLQLMFNEILVQTGKALTTASRYGKKTVPADNFATEAKIEASLEAYHRALDDLEGEIIQAKSVLLRDLNQIRSRRAPPPPPPQPELRQVAPTASMVIDLDESPEPRPKLQPGSASKVVGPSPSPSSLYASPLSSGAGVGGGKGGGSGSGSGSGSSGGGPKSGKKVVAPFPNMGGFDMMTVSSAPSGPNGAATSTITTTTPAVPMKAAKGIPRQGIVAAAQQQRQPGRSTSAPPRKDNAKMALSASGVQMARSATSASQPPSRPPQQPGAMSLQGAGAGAGVAPPPPAAGPTSMFTTMTFTLAPTSPDPHSGLVPGAGGVHMFGGGGGGGGGAGVLQAPVQQQQLAVGNNIINNKQPATAAMGDEGGNSIDSLLDLGGTADMGEMDYDMGGGGDGETGTFDNFFFGDSNGGSGAMGTGEFESAYFGGM